MTVLVHDLKTGIN